MTLAIDDQGRRQTERLWVSPPIIKDTYMTTEATPLSDKETRVTLLATFKHRIPVISHLVGFVVGAVISRNLRKDMAGLKEFCETGRVAAREAATAKSGPP